MPRQSKSRKDLYLERMFETRSEAWERVGLSVDVSERVVRRARREAAVIVLLIVGVLVAYSHRSDLIGKTTLKNNLQTPIQIGAVLVLVALGWALARDIGKSAGPTFMRRMDPGTAGTVGFLIRLLTIAITALVALRIAGIQPQTLAVGGAFTAVVLGLAAQQTLGNVIAGMVLLSARPFRVGERIRLQAGAVGGLVEGIVSSLGLLYTTLARGADRIMIPNSVVLAAVVVPLREPNAVDVKVRLTSGVRPSQVQAILDEEVSTPTRSPAQVLLEEVDGDDLVVRVQATPELAGDGARLADEIIAALSSVTGEHAVQPSESAASR
ncbi:MAG TPA: mechanosensitive ion channel family protein [Solirubrobacteraceae bacterium]